MSEEKPPPIVQATPFQRFTIRLIDGKFVRVPKADLPSMESAKQTVTSNQTEIRELFRLVNGRFMRVLNLDPEDDSCVGKPLPDEKTPSAESEGGAVAKKKD